MAMPAKGQRIISERQRQLQIVNLDPSSVFTRELPRDTVLKYLQLRLSGSLVTTFGSGTPVADAQSTFDNLIANISITVNGSRTVKSVRPHLMAMQQLLFTSQNNERKAVAGSAATNVLNPTTDAGFVYGTTGQMTTFAESILIAFENIAAKTGKESTWLNLKGVASAEIRFTSRAFSSLLSFGNTAPVVYAVGLQPVQIAITTVEAQDIEPQTYFSDFKQTTKEESFSSQASGRLIDLNRGNYLQGVMFFAQDGAAGSATTATGKVASNLLLTNMKLKINGQIDIKSTTFLQLQAENRNKFGVIAPYAGNVSRLDGVAYLDMLRDGDLTTALDVRPPMVDQVQLEVDTRPSSDVSYTNPAIVTIMTNEIVAPIV